MTIEGHYDEQADIA